jgi:hypothetical protein
MNFLERTLRDWKVRLEPIAAQKPVQLKESSETEASPTPTMMGSSEATTGSVGASRRTSAERRTEKAGSAALIVCVKETATAPRETLVRQLPSAWTAASGAMPLSDSAEARGRASAPAAHAAAASAPPSANWTAVHVSGYGKAARTCLLKMLK